MKARIFLPLLLTALVATGFSASVWLTAQPESRIWVDGTSTVHDWTCEVTTFEGTFNVRPEAWREVKDVTITVPAQALECKNGTMNKKARAALDADDHPVITYTLRTAEVTEAGAETFELTATGDLAIAGTTRPVTLSVAGTVLDDGRVHYTGSVPLLMSDFGIDPPTAMLGALKTGNDVTVRFDVTAGAQ